MLLNQNADGMSSEAQSSCGLYCGSGGTGATLGNSAQGMAASASLLLATAAAAAAALLL